MKTPKILTLAALLASLSATAAAGPAIAQDPADPWPAPVPGTGTDRFQRGGIWQCRFIKPANAVAANYYSFWWYGVNDGEANIWYSPVHKGAGYPYELRGDRLILDGHAFKTTWDGDTMVIHDPKVSWKGWRCTPGHQKTWPADGLQYLDYARYPWLRGMAEDDHEIAKYEAKAAWHR